MLRAINQIIRSLALTLTIGPCLSAVPVLAAAAKKPCFTDEQAKGAINDWKSANKDFVMLDKAVRPAIRQSLTGNTCLKPDNLNSWADSQSGFVIGSYLYELRDRKYASMGVPDVSGTTIKIAVDDVRAFPFDTYLSTVAWQDPGELIVDSKPPGASISIDGKPLGITKKDLVISKGKHSILVKLASQSCTDTIEIHDEPFSYTCPKSVPKSPEPTNGP